jgi:hypothetical protein
MRSTTFISKNFILVLLETISLASFIQHGVGVDSSEENITNFLQLPFKQKNLLIKNWLRKLDGRNEKKKPPLRRKTFFYEIVGECAFASALIATVR